MYVYTVVLLKINGRKNSSLIKQVECKWITADRGRLICLPTIKKQKYSRVSI